MILKVTDTKSSRCLFQLVPLEPPTDETGCSSSDGVLLQTPTAVQTDEPPEKMRARAEKNGYKNGTKFGSLTSQVKYDPRVQPFLKTPCAADSYTDKMKSKGVSGTSGTLAQEIVNGYAEKHRGLLLPTPVVVDNPHPNSKVNENGRMYNNKAESSHSMGLADRAQLGLLPTPTSIEGVKWTNTWNPNSQMGQSLSAMAGSGMLPTPIATDISHKRRIEELKEAGGQTMASRANGASRPNGLSDFIEFYGVDETQKSENAGQTSRLSPLFTEEMMGFPLMWTALPFLLENG